MTRAPEPDRGAIAFAERLMTVLSEGRFTATYKYAVLLALMDLCLEYSTRAGSAPESVTTRQLAEKVLALYWPHTLPYQVAGAVLWQNPGRKQAGILSEIRRFRERKGHDPTATLTRARHEDDAAWERLVRSVEWTLIEMPLPRLQQVGTELDEFLYHITWDKSVTRGQAFGGEFDNLIRFSGSAGDHLIRLSGLLRPLIEREWTQLVARFNQDVVPEMGLQEFLFGVSRVDLSAVRGPIHELAGGRCFYCDSRVRANPELDHFVPWSRFPDNGIENLVIADARCNNAKRDHLASARHVGRWLDRSREHEDDLERIAAEHGWDRHPERTEGVARSVYLRLPGRTKLWDAPGRFAPADREQLVRSFIGS